MKKKFIETPTCQSKIHCHACVLNENGIREQWMHVFDWDGKCPHGYHEKGLLEYPSILEQAKNLAKAGLKAGKAVLVGKRLFVSKEIKAERQTICDTCEFYDIASSRCSKCGCSTEIKLSLATESCPIEKWGTNENDVNNIKEKDMLNDAKCSVTKKVIRETEGCCGDEKVIDHESAYQIGFSNFNAKDPKIKAYQMLVVEEHAIAINALIKAYIEKHNPKG